MLKPRTIHTEIKIDHSQKPIFSMSRSWLTFEIENTEIKNVENGLFPKCSYKLKYILFYNFLFKLENICMLFWNEILKEKVYIFLTRMTRKRCDFGFNKS